MPGKPSPRRIVINALGANMGGAMRHLTNFLPALGSVDAERRYTVLVQEGVDVPGLPDNIELKRVVGHVTGIAAARMAHDLAWLPLASCVRKSDVLVSMTNFGPIWAPVPHVIFQRNSLYYCPYFLSIASGRQKAATLVRRSMAIATMKRAKLIVTPSDAMAEMIKEAVPHLRGKKFVTLYHGYSPEGLEDPLDDAFSRRIGAPSARVKLLYPTHPGPHKGFEVLFDMMSALKERGMDFMLVTTIGLDDWPSGVGKYMATISRLGLDDRVVLLGRVPQRQMGALYRSFDLMVYPSLCESFGFSLIEALGHGLPIVASDTRVNREICADAAEYYPALSPGGGVGAIIAALAEPRRSQLREAARRRASGVDWSWARYAREFVSMLEETA